MITIKEMAEMLGISTTTVSNVINGKTSEVSQKTAEKVQKLLDEYDYVPNMNAKNLAQNHSRLIGIVLKRRKDKYENIFTDPFHGELLGALEAAIREQGYYMMIYISENIEEIVRNIVSWNTEGLILIGMLHDDYLKIRSKYKISDGLPANTNATIKSDTKRLYHFNGFSSIPITIAISSTTIRQVKNESPS